MVDELEKRDAQLKKCQAELEHSLNLNQKHEAKLAHIQNQQENFEVSLQECINEKKGIQVQGSFNMAERDLSEQQAKLIERLRDLLFKEDAHKNNAEGNDPNISEIQVDFGGNDSFVNPFVNNNEQNQISMHTYQIKLSECEKQNEDLMNKIKQLIERLTNKDFEITKLNDLARQV